MSRVVGRPSCQDGALMTLWTVGSGPVAASRESEPDVAARTRCGTEVHRPGGKRSRSLRKKGGGARVAEKKLEIQDWPRSVVVRLTRSAIAILRASR